MISCLQLLEESLKSWLTTARGRDFGFLKSVRDAGSFIPKTMRKKTDRVMTKMRFDLVNCGIVKLTNSNVKSMCWCSDW